MDCRPDDQLAALTATRDRTVALVAEVDERDLSRTVDPLLSPLLWDLGHIANFEHRWLLGGDDAARDGIYNPFAHRRADRGELSMLGRAECFEYMSAVRSRVLDALPEADPARVELVIQHEQQHNETMLQLLRQLDSYSAPCDLRDGREFRLASTAAGPNWVRFPAGHYLVGSDPEDRPLVYDNECRAHRRELHGFDIAMRPVTNGEFIDWIELGGYVKPEWWTPEGWEWLIGQSQLGDPSPLAWRRTAAGWEVDDFGRTRPVDPAAPVSHISWFEADAFARASGARLPTEFEWEVAASHDPVAGADGARRRYPWGDEAWVPGEANLDQLTFGVEPVACAEGACGPVDMLGQVWEWTSSEFRAYPGFEAFAYAEYSAPFFDGGYRVLRGGSSATRARSVSNTFRNWDLPERRQIFAGLRLARSVRSPAS